VQEETVTSRPRARVDLLVALSLFAAALSIRALLWNSIDGHPWWLAPLLDARLYHRLGEAIAGGGIAALGDLPVGPLYPVIIGSLYSILPDDPWTVRIVQGLLGASLPPILFVIGRRIGGRTAGIASGLLALLCGPLVAHETDLTPASLSVLAVTIFTLLCLPGISGRPSAFARGALFALAISLRPNLLLLLPVPLLLTWRRDRTASALLSLGAGFALVVLPQSLLIHRGGGSGLVAPHGGINLYIGNHHGATGIWRSPWPWHGDVADFNLAAPRAEAERITGHAMTPPMISRFWTGRAVAFWRERPGEALSLTARKGWLLLNNIEVPLNLPYPIVRREVPLLGALAVSWGILLPLAFLGYALRPPGTAPERVLVLLLLGGAATILPFFVADRYRLCLYPPLILLSGLGVKGLLQRHPPRSLAAPLVVAVALVTVAHLPAGLDLAGEGLSYRFNMGVNLLRAGRLDEADALFSPLTTGPMAVQALTNRGAVALRRGDGAGAAILLRDALALDPTNPVAGSLLAGSDAAPATVRPAP
jgi:4-amino-4-deoxy-L-arabinose transferase-like glycosyltransferase